MKILNSIEDVVLNYPKKVKNFIKQLDLNRNDFSHLKSDIKEKKYINALRKLLHYFEENYNKDWVNYIDFSWRDYYLEELQEIPNYIFTFQNVKAKIPRRNNGHLDWSWKGPNNDREFGFFLNRMHYLKVLYHAYKRDNDEDYIKIFDYIIQDWLISNPCPKWKKNSVQWRPLEAALRVMNVWTFCFFEFQHSKFFRPATKVLFLISIPEHAKYLKKYVVPRGNIRVMILASLSTIGAIWPEFKHSQKWIQYALKLLIPEISEKQVYPDGIQKELTNHYHYVTLVNFEQVQQMVIKSGINVPQVFSSQIKNMWNYYAMEMRPDGFGLLNNDSDRDYVRERILEASKRYNNLNWKYIGTNGKEGKKPDSLSFISPYAGYLIMRDGWNKDAQWGFYDFGPFGLGHQHKDKLHISISAFGRDLLVDSGRYHYIHDKWREDYFKATISHNTIIIDEKSQKKYNKTRSKPINSNFYESTDNYDYVAGQFSAGYEKSKEKIIHKRYLKYYRGKYWLVVDEIDFLKPHLIQVLWHFHPKCNVKINDRSVVTTDLDKGNIRITSLSRIKWNIDLVKGQKFPKIQGWWSKEYNHKEPCYCAIFSKKIEEKTRFYWLLDVNLNLPPIIGDIEIEDIKSKSTITKSRISFNRNSKTEKIEIKYI